MSGCKLDTTSLCAHLCWQRYALEGDSLYNDKALVLHRELSTINPAVFFEQLYYLILLTITLFFTIAQVTLEFSKAVARQQNYVYSKILFSSCTRIHV